MPNHKRSVSASGRDFIPIPEDKLDRLVLPSAQDYREKFEKYIKQKSSIDKKVYLKLLKSLEEELLTNIAKVQAETPSKDTEFLLIRREQDEESKIEPSKLLYWKKLFSVNYMLNNQIYNINYLEYEEVSSVLEAKQELLRQMKEIFKNSVKYCVQLKEKNKSLDHNLAQYTTLAAYKQKEYENMEKKFHKLMKQKQRGKRSRSVFGGN